MDTWGQPETSDNWLPGFHDEFQDLFPDINFDTDPVHCTTYEFETMMAPEFNLSFLAEYDRPFDSTAECSSFSEACDISTVHFQHNVDIVCPEDVLLTPRSIAVPPAELLEAPCRPENSQTDIQNREIVKHNRSKAKNLKWNDSIVIFPANADSKKTPRQRRSFGSTRRKEVALTRRVGACVQCKLKKASVSPRLLVAFYIVHLTTIP
jgi:hypothetical protein